MICSVASPSLFQDSVGSSSCEGSILDNGNDDNNDDGDGNDDKEEAIYSSLGTTVATRSARIFQAGGSQRAIER